MQICDPVLRYRKSGFFYNGRIFRGKSFCLVNNKKLTKTTGGIISLRFYLKVKCNEQGEKEMKRKIVIGMLVLSMAVSATACSSKKEETAKAETSQSTDTEKASETADEADSSDERNAYGLTEEETEKLAELVKEKVKT